MGDDEVDRLVASLHANATTATGLSDFGPDDYHEGLRRLVAAVVDLDPPVAGGAGGLLQMLALGQLVTRLRTEEAWRQYPGVGSLEVGSPLVITGIPRTGTTALHGLLAVDPRFQVIEHWLQQYPQPRPPRSTWADRADYRQVVAMSAMLPDILRMAHLVLPEEGDECLFPMAQSFVSNMFGSQASIPDYDSWMLAQDMTPSFVRYADYLRLIGSTSPGTPWLLKNPSHVFCLDELFAVFPGARIIQTHRHPQEALGSVVSLLTGIGAGFGYERSSKDIAAREVPLWAEGVRRASAARQGRRDRFCDVDYRQFVAEPLGVVRGIYDRFGLELAADVEREMSRWVEAHPQNAQGKHVYDPEALGLDTATIEQHYGTYMEEFGLQ
jgi:hypothetical protein